MYSQRHQWILASGSPRRKEFLTNHGFRFRVDTADIDEGEAEGETVTEYTARLARAKAERVARRHASNRLIIAADTAVEHAGTIFGKPKDTRDSFHILAALNGNTHRVVTSFCLILESERKKIVETCVTKVRFCRNPTQLLRAYAQSAEPKDKAGSYSVQGLGSVLVESIEGSFSNAAGFPTEIFIRKLFNLGWITLTS